MVSSTLVKFVFVCLGSAKRDSSWAARAEGQSQSGSEREGAAADRNTGKISAVLTKPLSAQCCLILIKAISKVLTGHPTSLQSVLSLLVNNYLIHMSLKAWQKETCCCTSPKHQMQAVSQEYVLLSVCLTALV